MRDPERVIIEIEGRDDIPDKRQRNAAIIKTGIQYVLIGIDDLFAIPSHPISQNTEDAVDAPTLEIDQQHTGLKIAELLGNIVRSATRASGYCDCANDRIA